MKTTSFLLSTAICLASLASSLDPITVKGNAFYQGNDRFYIRGVDYQPGGSSKAIDPLADADNCKRDVPYFKDLGLNTIRVYTVDNSANHDECMQELSDAGIYLLLDVNTPKNSINRADPAPSYNADYLQAVFATIDAFKGYDNVLGFFAGNEVINSVNTTGPAPYVKAVVRDMKSYISAQSKRAIPVGYSAADIAQNRWQQMEYFNCGDDSERIDLFGMNDYSWCGPASSFQISGYQANVQNYGNYSLPLFFSEYGCNTVQPRTFPEISAIYNTEMTSVYSGGLVYEYSSEGNDYGLVNITGSNVTTLSDYDALKSQLAKYPDPTGAGGASTTNSAASCPPFQSGLWEVDPSSSLPALPSGAETYIKNGAGKPLGLSGPSTQFGSSSDDDNGSSSASASATASSGAASSGGSSTASAKATHTSKGAAGHVEVPHFLTTTVLGAGAYITVFFAIGLAL
ncbi:1,3-beta-glucanosyltransferase GAS1 [Sugiyamaella lignohabitans]|uniref:1,3-beta-glucanosyltransferase n=1 Tax=Sugiyamaella lignohabitans TaxID=796027 RepID=A0A161HJU4_9ASCO|nr:1,3-beta-glucanosyltransferase GAS1 [Sugiyamaella lignohabitans]ANB11758.1 1,3-beta-glucanosyltransferase GAS1 [Sugiyamaella lignohabitans]